MGGRYFLLWFVFRILAALLIMSYSQISWGGGTCVVTANGVKDNKGHEFQHAHCDKKNEKVVCDPNYQLISGGFIAPLCRFSCPNNARCEDEKILCTKAGSASIPKCDSSSTGIGYGNFKGDCPTGSYFSMPAGRCISCPDHGICSAIAFTGCEDGYFSSNRSCTLCPDGAICSATAMTGCKPTHYSANGGCTLCPEGAACSATAMTGCKPTHYSANGGCTLCPEGALCNGKEKKSFKEACTGDKSWPSCPKYDDEDIRNGDCFVEGWNTWAKPGAGNENKWRSAGENFRSGGLDEYRKVCVGNCAYFVKRQCVSENGRYRGDTYRCRLTLNLKNKKTKEERSVEEIVLAGTCP